MSIDEQLAEIQERGIIAMQQVAEAKFDAARKTIGKLRRSCFVSETERVIAIVEAKILLEQGKAGAARERILESIGYLWGVVDGLGIIAASNPKADNDTKLYQIEILGGLATLGMFTQFTQNHIAKFDVAANTREEALRYIEEVARFAAPDSMQLMTCVEQPLKSWSKLSNEFEIISHRGVLMTYPFRSK